MCIATLFNKEDVYKLLKLELFILCHKINRAQYCLCLQKKITNHRKIV